MSEKEKMLRGEIYDPSDEELGRIQTQAEIYQREFNTLTRADYKKKKEILKKLLPQADPSISIRGPIYVDYGAFIKIGKYFYANYNLTILDVCPVTIGDNVYCGTGVTMVTPMHPLLGEERRLYEKDGHLTDKEYGKPITIGNDVWICSNVTICGGVTIGDNVVIGAGSVVTRDIPSNVLAAGNPCKVIRPLTKEDSLFYKK